MSDRVTLVGFALVGCLGCGDGGGSSDPATSGAAGDGSGGDVGAGGGPPGGGGGGSGGAGASSSGGGGQGGLPVDPEGWQPPIGIPEPPFGIRETAEECVGCTVIQKSDLEGLDDLAPGTIVELSGGPFDGGQLLLGGNGTPDLPIFIRGADPQNRPIIHRETGVVGSYIIVENVDFDFDGQDRSLGVLGDHIAIRGSLLHGYRATHNSTILFVQSSTDIVLYANEIFDNGDFGYPGELDIHGIGASESWGVWIVDNLLHQNRGDSMQFGHQADNTLGDFYVGRNDIYGDGENCIDIKEASNVVISENRLHATGLGMPTVVLHDCPQNAAVIYNEVYDNGVGVSLPSLESGCQGPVSLIVVRNEMHDLDVAIQGWGSGKEYYITGNSFTSVTTPIDLSNVSSSSIVATDDTDLQEAFDAFEAIYGIDISDP